MFNGIKYFEENCITKFDVTFQRLAIRSNRGHQPACSFPQAYGVPLVMQKPYIRKR